MIKKIATVFALLIIGTALAADVKLSARVGLGGKVRENSWFPIIIDVETEAETIDGTVEVLLADERGDMARYASPVKIIGKAHKRFFIYVRSKGFQRSAKVLLISRGQIILRGEIPLLAVSPATELIGLCGKAGSGVEMILGSYVSESIAKTVIELEDLPDRWLGYDGLTALLLADVDLEKLDLSQRRALKAWVRAGGQLILILGDNWASANASIVSDIIPLHLKARTSISAEALRGFPLISSVGVNEADRIKCLAGTPKSGLEIEEVGRTGPSAPAVLAARAQIGFGTVTLICVDLCDYPFSSWPDRARYVARLILVKEPLKIPEDRPMMGRGGPFREETESALLRFMEKFRGMSTIPWPVAALLAAAYIIVVCVVDYRVLKKRNLLKLTWFTFTGYALTFSLVAFLLSAIIKGRALQQRTLSMVDVSAGDGIARGQTYVSFFSSAPRRYDFVSRNKNVFPSIMGSYYTSGASGGTLGGDEYFILHEDYLQLRGIPIPVWTAKSFQILWYDDWKSLFQFELKREGEIFSGKITNQSRYDFKHCVLMTRDSRYHIEELPSGESAVLSTDPVNWHRNTWDKPERTNFFKIACPISNKQGGEVFATFMDFETETRPDFDFEFRRGFFVEPARYHMKKIFDEGRWVFLAFTKEEPIDIKASNAFPSEENFTLVRVVGPPISHLQPGRGNYENLEEFFRWKMEQERQRRRR